MKALYATCGMCGEELGLSFDEEKPKHEAAARKALEIAAERHRAACGGDFTFRGPEPYAPAPRGGRGGRT